jgi:hypothetical protein
MAEYERRFDTGEQGGMRDLSEQAGDRAEEISAAAQDKAQEYGQKAEDFGARAQGTAQQYGEKAQEQADKAREQTAGGMERAAEMVRERTEGSSGMQAQVGAKAADTLDNASIYLKSHNTTEIWNDVEVYAKEHPGQALAGAILAGFLLGRILR